MKVYQIITKPYQDFSFYNRNGVITLCSDPKYPYIGGNSMYDGETKSWTTINNPTASNSTTNSYTITNGGTHINIFYAPEKFTCSSWFVEKKFYIQNILEQLGALFETSLQTYGNESFNIFVFKRHVNDKLLSVGLCARQNIKSIRCHSKFTKYCQRLSKLKVYW